MKALIVEDHAPTAQILIRSLASSGHEGTICHSAEEALDLLEECSIGSFELYLLDLKLPGMDGISLCRWIRSHQEDAEPHVIVGTGSDHSEELTNAFDAGADDYVEKPYSARILSLRFAVACEQIAARKEKRRLNAALNQEKDFVSAVFDTAAALIVALDSDGKISKVNQATCDLTGRSESEIEGLTFFEPLFDDSEETGAIQAQLQSLMEAKEGTCRFESQFTRTDDSPQSINWLCRFVPKQGEDSSPEENDSRPAIVCVGTDITERRKMEAQLAFLAERDPLTNLYNRSQLEPAVQSAIDAVASGHSAALLYLDLDDFKTVNDSAGHAAGDELLQLVSSTLGGSVRPDDIVIRLGGDEFILILNQSSPEQARAAGERICTEIDELAYYANERVFRVTASIGAVLLDESMTVEEAVGQADAACYASKNNGRNTLTFAGETDAQNETVLHDTDWHERIKSALADGGFKLWLQPIVSFRTGKPAFHEALLRLETDSRCYHPGEFMNPARRFNLLPEIDRAVVRQALTLAKAHPGLNLTVNLSGRSVADSRLPEFLVTETRQADVCPSRLVFEITESDFIRDLPNAIERLGELKERGFRFAIDDFGQGYSSFNYLRNLPVEMVKIDGSYTQNLVEDETSAAFIRAITDLAHSIGLRCVAEHVENEDALRLLHSLGVDYAQGYFTGLPQSVIDTQKAKTHAPDRLSA